MKFFILFLLAPCILADVIRTSQKLSDESIGVMDKDYNRIKDGDVLSIYIYFKGMSNCLMNILKYTILCMSDTMLRVIYIYYSLHQFSNKETES